MSIPPSVDSTLNVEACETLQNDSIHAVGSRWVVLSGFRYVVECNNVHVVFVSGYSMDDIFITVAVTDGQGYERENV